MDITNEQGAEAYIRAWRGSGKSDAYLARDFARAADDQTWCANMRSDARRERDAAGHIAAAAALTRASKHHAKAAVTVAAARDAAAAETDEKTDAAMRAMSEKYPLQKRSGGWL